VVAELGENNAGDKPAVWLDLDAGDRLAQLIVWDSGELEAHAGDRETGAETVNEYRESASEEDLMRLLGRVLDELGVTLSLEDPLPENTARDAIEAVLGLQPLWTAASTDEMRLRGLYIRGDLRDWFAAHATEISSALGIEPDDLIAEGRDQTGQRSQIPWVRFASRNRSRRATEGWYVVLLFAADGERMYASLNQGTQLWDGSDFRDRPREEISARVSWARAILSDARVELAGSLESISLGGRSHVGPAYERANVRAFEYRRGHVPPDEQLLDDVLQLATALRRLYEAESKAWIPGDPPPEIADVITTSDSAAGRRSPARPAFRVNAAERRVIEMHAVKLATKHFEDQGANVRYVGDRRPYDLEVAINDQTLTIEVKGTVTPGEQILLTRNEVAHHRRAFPQNGLVVVHSIELDRASDPPVAKGGIVVPMVPWEIDDERLAALAFQYATGLVRRLL
jgi:hypothetical protein